ncbi:MAG: NAD(P)H-dependent oxidoreductase subunit E, partial [Spirochaetia bacterium]
GEFTLLPAGCLGACDEGPAMMIDGKLYETLTPERADEILAEYGMGADAQTSHG